VTQRDEEKSETLAAPNKVHMARAASALRLVHQALADFRDELPDFRTEIAKCHTMLESKSALPLLPSVDQQFLLSVYNRIVETLDQLPLRNAACGGEEDDPAAAVVSTSNWFCTIPAARTRCSSVWQHLVATDQRPSPFSPLRTGRPYTVTRPGEAALM